MILAYLLLAHLIGDFVLQPAKLVEWKMKSIWGTLTHVLIHLATNLIVFIPLIVVNGNFVIIYYIFAISLIHFLIDEAKINYDLKHDAKVKPFVIDQLLHLLTIMVANFFLINTHFSFPAEGFFYSLYQNVDLIIFVSFLIVVSKVIEILNFQKVRELNEKATLQVDSQAMLRRVTYFTLIYAFFMFVTFYLS